MFLSTDSHLVFPKEILFYKKLFLEVQFSCSTVILCINIKITNLLPIYLCSKMKLYSRKVDRTSVLTFIRGYLKNARAKTIQ